MSPIICKVLNCPYGGSRRRMFRFPVKNRERCLKWIRATGRSSLILMSDTKLYMRGICSGHFREDEVLSSGRLFRNSNPTISIFSSGADNSDAREYDYDPRASIIDVDGGCTAADVSIPLHFEFGSIPINNSWNLTNDEVPSGGQPQQNDMLQSSHHSSFVYRTKSKPTSTVSVDKPYRKTAPNVVQKMRMKIGNALQIAGHSAQDDTPISNHKPNEIENEPDREPATIIVQKMRTQIANALQISENAPREDTQISNQEPNEIENEHDRMTDTNIDPQISGRTQEDAPVSSQEANEYGQVLVQQVLNRSEEESNKVVTHCVNTVTHCVIRDMIQKPFSSLSYDEQRLVFEAGRPTPAMEFLRGKTTETHRNPQYFETNNYDKNVWLTGSRVLKKLFCWPCLLFGSANKKTSVWRYQGFNDLDGLSKATMIHSNSLLHLQHSVKFAVFKSARVEVQLTDTERLKVTAHNDTVRMKRDILRRMVDSICLLAKLNMPFRSSDDSKLSLLHISYLAIIDSLSEHDKILNSHLKTPGVVKLSCSNIRNDLISAIRAVMLNKIKQEVASTKFVSIILCLASDVTNEPQLSTILRYVDMEGVAQERYIGDAEFDPGLSRAALSKHIFQVIEDFNIESKLVALMYDGQVLGMCPQIQNKYPCGLFLSNVEPKLNLVLVQVCSKIKNCRLYISMISGIATFFSTPSTLEALILFITCRTHLKPTMLNFTKHLEKAIWDFYPHLQAFFNNIIQHPEIWSADAIVDAQGFSKFLLDFSTTFLLFAFANLFSLTDKYSDVMFYNSSKSTHLLTILNAQRNNFDYIWEVVERKRKNWAIVDQPLPPKRKKQWDPGNSERMHRHLYWEIIDTIIKYLLECSSETGTLTHNTSLNAAGAVICRHSFSTTRLETLEVTYPESFNYVRLEKELHVLHKIDEFINIPPHELMSQMRLSDAKSVLPEVFSLACLCATIPFKYSLADMPNSALKRMKYAREMLGQHRKSNLGLLSTENLFLLQLKEQPKFYEEILDEFAKNEARLEFRWK